MIEPFKNIKELYQALIDGKTIQNNKNLDQAKLGFDKLLYKAHAKEHFVYPGLDYVFYQTDQWSIYEEPKWYDNIPEWGVLCWVTGTKKPLTSYTTIRLIEGLNAYNQFVSAGNIWNNAIPLTKEEVMQYIWCGYE